MIWTWLMDKIGLRTILLTIGTLALGLFIFLAWRHYTGLLETINTLKTNSALLESAVGTQEQTIQVQQKALQEWKKNQEELTRLIQESHRIAQDASSEVRRLNAIFVSHDLDALAKKKPGLIQQRINSGSDLSRQLLECSSGAKRDDCPGRNPAPGKTDPSTASANTNTKN